MALQFSLLERVPRTTGTYDRFVIRFSRYEKVTEVILYVRMR